MNDNQRIKNWYSNIPDDRRIALRDRIIQECRIATTDVFYNWYRGRTAIPPLAKAVIESIASEKIFES